MNGMRNAEFGVVLLALAVLHPGPASAAPAVVPYVGLLAQDVTDDGQDTPVPYDGVVAMTVEVFDKEADGQLLWGPCEFGAVTVENGMFVVVLDALACPGLDSTPLPEAGAWLQFTVTKDAVPTLLQGRQQFLSVPFALQADSAQTCEVAQSVDGVDFSTFVSADEAGAVVVQGDLNIQGDQDIQGTVTAGKVVVGEGEQALDLAATVMQLQQQVQDMQETIAALESGDCPPGYSKVADANIPATGFYCRKAVGGGKYDEMAKVGDFWIDRYEVSIWQNSDCTGTQYGGTNDNWSSSGATGANGDNGFFPRNGNWTTPLYGCSVPGVTPSRWMTWFQAQQVCAAQGKHLCTNGEWQMAGAGTPDPGAWPDMNETGGCTTAPITGKCNTCSTGPRATGDAWYLNLANSCMSAYGAFDMVGNLWEWADLWGQAGADKGISQGASATPWPNGYRGDGTWNINGEAYDGSGWKTAIPASASRGGGWGFGPAAGVFALGLHLGPSYWDDYYGGARCCRR